MDPDPDSALAGLPGGRKGGASCGIASSEGGGRSPALLSSASGTKLSADVPATSHMTEVAALFSTIKTRSSERQEACVQRAPENRSKAGGGEEFHPHPETIREAGRKIPVEKSGFPLLTLPVRVARKINFGLLVPPISLQSGVIVDTIKVIFRIRQFVILFSFPEKGFPLLSGLSFPVLCRWRRPSAFVGHFHKNISDPEGLHGKIWKWKRGPDNVGREDSQSDSARTYGLCHGRRDFWGGTFPRRSSRGRGCRSLAICGLSRSRQSL